MKHLSFIDKSQYSVALLIKESALNPKDIQDNYPIDWEDSICFSLDYENNKAPVKLIKQALGTILRACKHMGVTTLLVCDTSYFKVLTKTSKAEPLYGSVCDCAIPGYDFKVILAPNYQALFYNPSIQSKLDLSINTLNNFIKGTHTILGSNVIKYEAYPYTLDEIQVWLTELLEEPTLTCDIETYGLSLEEAELASISFSWYQHEGIAFSVNECVKPILKQFFEDYTGTLIFHNITYDATHIIYRVFMKDYLDYEGMLHGLEVMTRSIHDTKIIAYLATNSCAGNDLKLKNLALPFGGNYGIISEEVSVKDIEIKDLLRYNLLDTLSTWYVYHKYVPIMIQDNQIDIYEKIMIPSIKSIIHMQLVGFPMEYSQIEKTAKELEKIQSKWLRVLNNSSLVKEYTWKLQKEAFINKNKELKKKHIPIGFFKTNINPNSGPQIAGLLYEHLGFDVINTTDLGLPATDGDTLKALYNQLINQYELTEEDLNVI